MTLVRTEDLEIQEKVRKNGADKPGVPSCLIGVAIRYLNTITIEIDVEDYKNILINGYKKKLKIDDTHTIEGVTIQYGNQNVEWRSNGYKTTGIKLVFPNGFGIMVSGGYCGVVEINVPESYFGKVSGLCGNADGKKDGKDFSDPNGTVMDVKYGSRNWEMSGYDGTQSPLSKWQLSWFPSGNNCLFQSGCVSTTTTTTTTTTTPTHVTKTIPATKTLVKTLPVDVHVNAPTITRITRTNQVPSTTSHPYIHQSTHTPKPTHTTKPTHIPKSTYEPRTSSNALITNHTNTSHCDLTFVHEFSNQTTKRLDMLKDKVELLIQGLVKDNEKQISQLAKNFNGSNNTLNIANDNYLKSMNSLNKLKLEITSLNNTMIMHYHQMISESKYLERLEMIKPEFLNSLTKSNAKLTNVENLIVAHIVQSDDKDQMMQLIKDIRNTTFYSTNDLSKQFLNHYEKYKKLIKSDSSQYSTDKLNLDQLLAKYNDLNKYNKELYEEYKRINIIVQKLQESMNLSRREVRLFKNLIQSISNILTRKSCVNFSVSPEKVTYIGSKNTQCATELLKSHIDNNLIR